MTKFFDDSWSHFVRDRWAYVFYGFLASGFVMPSLPAWALLFYLLYVPSLFARLAMGPLLSLPSNIWGGGLLFLWVLCSFIWSPTWHGIIDVGCTGLFIVGGGVASYDDPAFIKRVQRVCVAGASLNAAIALGKMLIGMTSEMRPGGIGMLHSTLPSVVIAGICLIWACEAFLSQKNVPKDAIIALSILPSFMFLSGSRAPIIEVGGALLCLLSRAPRYHWRSMIVVGGTSLTLCWGAFHRHIMGSMKDAVARGDSFHHEIWSTVWHTARQHPWIGYGFGTDTKVRIGEHLFAHAHNLYLEVFYQGGVVGEILLLAAYGWPAMRPREWNRAEVSVTTFIACAVLTDIAPLAKGPAEIWYILWVPWLCFVANGEKMHLSGFRSDSK